MARLNEWEKIVGSASNYPLFSIRRDSGEMKFSGIVGAGKKLGRQIGFPTANLAWIEPARNFENGVYAVEVYHEFVCYEGIMNIGNRPTIQNEPNDVTVEVHIFNFDQQIYGDKLEVSVLQFIRSEKKFNHLNALKDQIAQDIQTVKSIFQAKNQEPIVTQ